MTHDINLDDLRKKIRTTEATRETNSILFSSTMEEDSFVDKNSVIDADKKLLKYQEREKFAEDVKF